MMGFNELEKQKRNWSKRELLKTCALAGAGSFLLPSDTSIKLLNSSISAAHSQSLPDVFVGVDIAGRYLNSNTPSLLDAFINEAHASHMIIPDPWSIMASKVDEDNYQVQIMERSHKTIWAGLFNIDSSKGDLQMDKTRSCSKSQGKLHKARIIKVSETEMVFETYFKVAQLNWDLVPGHAEMFPQMDCG